MDGIDAFNRLLERIEELAEEGARNAMALSSARGRVSELEREVSRIPWFETELARLRALLPISAETPTPAPKGKDDDQPF